MSTVVTSVLAKLRPNGRELERLVRMETDPACAQRFEQLAPGPFVAALGLIAVGLYGVASAPLRLLRRAR